jgi:hypothetical protein
MERPMIFNRRTVFYYRHWFPRSAKAFDRFEYSTSVHYGFFWLGVIRYKA